MARQRVRRPFRADSTRDPHRTRSMDVGGSCCVLGCANAPNSKWTHALLGIGLALGIGILPFALRILGGGDVKALMVVGGFVGAAGVAKVALWSSAGCGLFAAVYWACLRFRILQTSPKLPVAAPLAIATWALTHPFT